MCAGEICARGHPLEKERMRIDSGTARRSGRRAGELWTDGESESVGPESDLKCLGQRLFDIIISACDFPKQGDANVAVATVSQHKHNNSGGIISVDFFDTETIPSGGDQHNGNNSGRAHWLELMIHASSKPWAIGTEESLCWRQMRHNLGSTDALLKST